jgi:hypothetical protein
MPGSTRRSDLPAASRAAAAVPSRRFVPPSADATARRPPQRPPVAAPRNWRVMNLVSRSRWLREAVCAVARTRAQVRGYRWQQELEGRGRRSVLGELDLATSTGELARQGFCEGLVLAPQLVDALVSFALLGTCYGDSDPSCGFSYADRAAAEAASGRRFSVATYLFTDEMDETIASIAQDPSLRAVIARYFGAPPVFLGRRLWWTLQSPEESFDGRLATCFYHYDRDDYRSVRVFFHLTAVDALHGQHVVLRGSHRRKALVHQLGLQRRDDANIERYYGAARIARIEGAAGTGFIEDTFCYHKATRPVAGDRLMLELGFGLRDRRRFPPPDRTSVRRIALPAPSGGSA